MTTEAKTDCIICGGTGFDPLDPQDPCPGNPHGAGRAVEFELVIVAAGPGCTSNVTVACGSCGATVTDWAGSEMSEDGLLPNQSKHAAFHAPARIS